MNKIGIIVSTTREGRSSEVLAKWFFEIAKKNENATFELIDLKKWDLPFLNNSDSPLSGKYDATQQKWADTIKTYDGFVVVTPEYNHGYPAALKNAFDLLYAEWGFKPVAFLTYGGASGGTRAAEQMRQVAIELRMIPVKEGLSIPFIWNELDHEAGRPKDTQYDGQASHIVERIIWYTEKTKALREDS